LDSRTSGNTADIDRLITHVTVTSRRHALFGQQVEVLQLVSDRGATWVTVRVPNGSRRNIRRALTDLAQPLADSKSAPLISGRLLLRVVNYVEALSRRLDEEKRNDENAIADGIGDPAAALDPSTGADPATAGRTDRAGAAPDAARSPRR
jgi:hypothetical protein